MGVGCISPAVYAAIVPGVAVAMAIGFAIGRAWERVVADRVPLDNEGAQSKERDNGG